MKTITPSLALCALLTATSADAALESRLSGLAVYDTNLNITWLADANYAQTSGYDADGMIRWNDANTWVNGLNAGGHSNWRLPNMDINHDGVIYDCSGPTVSQTMCLDNELGYMYYHSLGAARDTDLRGTQEPFQNIRSVYWSSTDWVGNLRPYWVNFYNGDQGEAHPDITFNVWAVTDGDVFRVASVPLPASAWLLGSGLLGLIGVARRKATN